MSNLLGPAGGPGLVHADDVGTYGAKGAILDVGFTLGGLAQGVGTILRVRDTAAGGSQPKWTNGRGIFFLGGLVSQIIESGGTTEIKYITASGTSADFEALIASSTYWEVAKADSVPTRLLSVYGNSPAALAVGGCSPNGAPGDVAMQIDGGGTASPQPGFVSAVYQPRVSLWDTCIGNGTTAPFTIASAGTGAAGSFAVTDDQHPMSRQYVAGTTSTGRFGLIWQTPVTFDTAGHQWRYEARFQIPTLSGATDAFNFSAGFTDSITTIDAVDGAYVKIDSNTAANFQCVTSANSVRTTTDSGIAAVAGTWYRVVIVVTNVTKVDFYIYAEGSSFPASPTVTITTNIPTGTTRATAAGAGILKSLGTTSRSVFVQYQLSAHDRLAA